MSFKPRLTLMNERFYSQCRKLHSMPYALEWEEQRAVNVLEEAKQCVGTGFSYFLGEQRAGR